MRVKQVFAAGLIVAAAACDSPVGGSTADTSFLRASLQGAVNMDFEGSGHFHSGTDPRRTGAPQMFSLSSIGRGGQADRFIQVYRPGSELPAPGVYSIGRGGSSFQAHYQQLGSRGETVVGFDAVEGELRITQSSAERVTGTFRFRALQTCTRTGSGVVTCSSHPLPDAAAVDVHGTFDAAPAAATRPLR